MSTIADRAPELNRVLAALVAGLRVAVRSLWMFASWMAFGFLVALAVILSAAPLAGYSTLTVLTGSMEPVLPVGSVLVVESIGPQEARLGDVVTFVDPENPERLITHRLREKRVRAQMVNMVTIGDRNDAPERWSVPRDGEIGRAVYRAPLLGHAREWVSGSGARLILTGVVVLLAGWVLVDVWRPERPREDPR